MGLGGAVRAGRLARACHACADFLQEARPLGVNRDVTERRFHDACQLDCHRVRGLIAPTSASAKISASPSWLAPSKGDKPPPVPSVPSSMVQFGSPGGPVCDGLVPALSFSISATTVRHSSRMQGAHNNQHSPWSLEKGPKNGPACFCSIYLESIWVLNACLRGGVAGAARQEDACTQALQHFVAPLLGLQALHHPMKRWEA